MTPLFLRPATLLKKRLWYRRFPVNFVKFLRIPFVQNTSGWLLLPIPQVLITIPKNEGNYSSPHAGFFLKIYSPSVSLLNFSLWFLLLSSKNVFPTVSMIVAIYLKFPRIFWNILRKLFEHFPESFGIFPEFSRTFLGLIWKIIWNFLEHFPETFGTYLGILVNIPFFPCIPRIPFSVPVFPGFINSHFAFDI